MKVILPLLLTAGVFLALYLLTAGVVWLWRYTEFHAEADKIKLQKMRREAELDLLLKERQHTWSLEDIQRHRERLESQLDEMHRD